MFFCKNCGTKIENDNAKFCPNCGQKFGRNKEEIEQANAIDAENPKAISNGISEEEKNDNNSNKVKNKPVEIKPPKNDKEKILVVTFVVIIALIIGTTGTVVYLHKTGKFNIKKIKQELLSALHIKKSEAENNKNKSSAKPSEKTKSAKIKKNQKSTVKTKIASASSNSSAPAYVPTYSNRTSSFSSFRYSFRNARAYVTGSTANRSYWYNNSPGVIITSVIVSGVNTYSGNKITLRSKFYVQVPTNFSPQNVKLSYRVWGNGLNAYNTSYINVKYAGIYNVAINILSGLPAGTYAYALTVTSPATIEESAAGYIKVQ